MAESAAILVRARVLTEIPHTDLLRPPVLLSRVDHRLFSAGLVGRAGQ